MVLEQTLLILSLILVLGLVVPEFFKKFRLPFVTSLILIGAFIGPNGFNYIQTNEIIEFFGFLGSAFLMLMAGLEAKISHFQNVGKRVLLMASLNGLIPFIVGVSVTKFFGYSWLTAFLIGTIFVSSSIAIIVASVKETKLMKSNIGQSIISVAIIEDLFSLFLLAIILQTVSPTTGFPLPTYFMILIFSVFFLKMFLPEFTKFFLKRYVKKKDQFEGELRFVIVILLSILLYFSGLGVHPIVAAFIVGLLLSDVVSSKTISSKLHTLGYGMFVPVFFFIVGMNIDLGILASFDYRNIIMITIILGLLFSKSISGYFAGRIGKFSRKVATLFGIATTAQLTTTLAATYAASSLGILDTTLTTSIVILSVLTTVLAPIALSFTLNRKKGRKRG